MFCPMSSNPYAVRMMVVPKYLVHAVSAFQCAEWRKSSRVQVQMFEELKGTFFQPQKEVESFLVHDGMVLRYHIGVEELMEDPAMFLPIIPVMHSAQIPGHVYSATVQARRDNQSQKFNSQFCQRNGRPVRIIRRFLVEKIHGSFEGAKYEDPLSQCFQPYHVSCESLCERQSI